MNAFLSIADYYIRRRVELMEGRFLFMEPLDMNPIGELVRSLTKKTRTGDEESFRISDIAEMKKRFHTQFFL